MDHRKAIILSINLCSSEFTQTGGEESQALQDRLSQMNARWDRVCSLLEEWRGLLQGALMQCQVRGALGRLCSHSHVCRVWDLVYQGHQRDAVAPQSQYLSAIALCPNFLFE